MVETTLSRRDFPEHNDEPFRPAVTEVRCPKCRSADLMLVETLEAGTQWAVRDGRLNRQAGYHEFGAALRVEARCDKCGHGWRLKKVQQISDCVKELDPKTFEPIE